VIDADIPRDRSRRPDGAGLRALPVTDRLLPRAADIRGGDSARDGYGIGGYGADLAEPRGHILCRGPVIATRNLLLAANPLHPGRRPAVHEPLHTAGWTDPKAAAWRMRSGLPNVHLEFGFPIVKLNPAQKRFPIDSPESFQLWTESWNWGRFRRSFRPRIRVHSR